jgi:hypothetical protein
MWETFRNRGPVRVQTEAPDPRKSSRYGETDSNLAQARSQSPYYSQVLMVAKSDCSRRMCIDFRNLNECTEDASFPVPHVKQMFARIGPRKPKLFGTMDLTQGYHQAPLTTATRAYTSFITYSGVYQFTRLPFGLKRAPSCFQEVMAAVVLAGLIYMICKMYIDDCIVYVCRPTTQLKSFLGLTKNFRDFFRDHSTKVHPLNSMLSNYSKTKKREWTKETLESFHLIKAAVAKCTTTHFLNDTDPIVLHTDASDYGIGGCLFQVVEGKEHPIAFVSKSLSLAQPRWAVIQKEAYAIFFVCMHLKSLLRDRKFTLRTDHFNLLYITENSNPMIVRWYIALSEYSFNLEFISGDTNGVADSTSRLCRNNMKDAPREYSEAAVFSASIIEKFTLTKVQYRFISSVHNSNVGHFGLDRTLKRLKAIGKVWEFQRQHVRYFIDHCLKIAIHAHGFNIHADGMS